MSFLRRIFGTDRPAEQPTLTVSITTSVHGVDDRLAVVDVGVVRLDATVYVGYQRDAQDWSNGIRLMDPATGRWLRDDDGYPDDLLAAGARSIAVVGLGYHPESQSPAFGFGSLVRLKAEPGNPVDPNAIAVRSLDGRQLAGYVPADDLGRLRQVVPRPEVGLVVWENYTWRPRQRIGMRLLVGPSIRFGLVPSHEEERERDRRQAAYALGKERERAAWEARRVAAEADKVAAKAAKEQERQARAYERAATKAAQIRLEDERRSAGVCIGCGGPIEPASGRGRPPIRCNNCRAA